MNSINFLAIVYVLFIYNNVVYSMFKPGQITQQSHPMLTSLFNLAKDIRKYQTETAKQTSNANSGVPTDRKGVAKASTQKIKGVDMFSSLQKKVLDIPVDSSHKIENAQMSLLNSGIKTANIPADLHKVKKKTVAGVMCSQCRQRRDAKCMAIYCRNDETSSVSSRKGREQFKSQPVSSVLPVFFGKIYQRNHMDNRGAFQLKTVYSPPVKNVLGLISADSLPLNPTKTGKPFPDAIWLLPDTLFEKAHRLALDRMSNKKGRKESSPNNKCGHGDKTKSEAAINSDLALDMKLSEVIVNGPVVKRRIKDQAETVGSTVTSLDQQIAKAIHFNEGLINHVQSPTVEIPTNTYKPIVKDDEMLYLPSEPTTINPGYTIIQQEKNSVKTAISDTNNVENNRTSVEPLNIGVSNKFPNVKIEENKTDHNINVDKSSKMTDMQTIGEKLQEVKNDKNSMNRLILVVKGDGNTEHIAVHVGNGPIPAGSRLFDTRGQYSISKETDVQPTDLQLNHAAKDDQSKHSHHILSHQHASTHSSRNHQNTSTQSSMNHQHASTHSSMNHQNLSKHSNQHADHHHPPIVNINTVHIKRAHHKIHEIHNRHPNALARQTIRQPHPSSQ